MASSRQGAFLLSLPIVYDTVQALAGASRGRRILATDYIRARAGETILDIGCGTAAILDQLPDVQYVGFDENTEYVEAARRRYGQRGRFYCGTIGASQLDVLGAFDIVLALGVLHHLDDNEATQLFRIAKAVLKRSGRLVTIDGCYVAGQSKIARYLLSRDRGKFVRDEAGYLSIARQVFSLVASEVRHDIARFPYTHLITTCTQE